MSNLKPKIALALSQANPKAPVYRWRGRPLPRGPNALKFLAQPGLAVLEKDPIVVLRALYAATPPPSKQEFVEALFSLLRPSNVDVVVHVLAEVGRLDAIRSLLEDGQLKREMRQAIWETIAQKLSMEHHRFTDSDLTLTEGLLAYERSRTYKALLEKGVDANRVATLPLAMPMMRVVYLVERLRYLRLKRELLEGHNPEINTDRDALVSRMESLGFRKAISDTLYDVERRLQAAATPIDFKGCMDLTRTAFEEMVEDGAKAAAKKVARPLPKQAPTLGNFQPWCQYLENAKVLTGDEVALAQKLYNYLSNAGSHQLGSAPEQVRVSKNMVIEFGLMMVGRVQDLPTAATPSVSPGP